MKQTILLFISGIVLALMAVGGYFAAQTYFVSADEDIIPENIVIERISPTTATITFSTTKPSIASIECSTANEGPFSLCGAETQATATHDIRTSVLLDPDIEYHFFIKIRNVTFDNLGSPFVIPVKSAEEKPAFPDSLLGTCNQDALYNQEFDLNNDGCIRGNDKILYLQQ